MSKIMSCMFTFLLTMAICGLQAEGAEVNKDALSNPELPRMTGYEAKKLYDQGKLILVNAQESGASERNHILGAIVLPSDRPLTNVKFPMDIFIGVYCN